LGVNVVANYVGRFWSIASVYLFVPIYIRFLGMDAYGLIAFNAIVLALIFIADGGLSASFAREAAKSQSTKPLLDALVSIERVLWSILVLIGISFFIAAPMIADKWLGNVQSLDRELIIQSLRLMPLAFVPQIAMSLYFGGLMGLERQVAGNVLSTFSNFLRSGCVIVPIYFMPDIRVFFAWQALACAVMVITMRFFLISRICSIENYNVELKVTSKGNFSFSIVKNMGFYTLGMFSMSVIAAFNTQIDKIVVSSIVSLNKFAEYSLISTLSQIPFILTLPIAMALLPRFTKFIEYNENNDLINLYRTSTYYIASIGAASGFILILFFDDIIMIWLSGQAFSQSSMIAAQLLSIGSIFLTLQLTVYQLSLANGHVATNIKLGVVALFVSIPLQIILTINYGIIGASVPWLILNVVAFAVLGVALNRRFLVSSLHTYFLADTLPPVIIAGLTIGAAKLISNTPDFGPFASCLAAGFSGMVALAISHFVRKYPMHPSARDSAT
jgi:O-antigen/teichoic acid export membrane protein